MHLKDFQKTLGPSRERNGFIIEGVRASISKDFLNLSAAIQSELRSFFRISNNFFEVISTGQNSHSESMVSVCFFRETVLIVKFSHNVLTCIDESMMLS